MEFYPATETERDRQDDAKRSAYKNVDYQLDINPYSLSAEEFSFAVRKGDSYRDLTVDELLNLLAIFDIAYPSLSQWAKKARKEARERRRSHERSDAGQAQGNDRNRPAAGRPAA